MSTVAAKKKAPKVDPADAQAAAWADQYIRAKRDETEAEKAKDQAKAGLLSWLGELPCKVLPDGRTVHVTRTPIDAAVINRKAHTRTEVTVAPPPAN